MYIKNFHIFIIIFIASTQIISAQKDSTENLKNFWSDKMITIENQNGYVFPTNDFIKGRNTTAARLKNYEDFSIKFSKQTYGDKTWEQIFSYPEWGVGLYTANFHNANEIGHPIAIFAFMNAPFVRWRHSSLNYEIGFGATGNWRSFKPLTNQYNIAICAGES